MKIATLALVLGVLLVGCAEKPPEKILPTLPAKVNPVNVKWKVVAEVREIDGKKYLVMPYDGNPYVALSYPDSLIFRSWMNDVKRQKTRQITFCVPWDTLRNASQNN